MNFAHYFNSRFAGCRLLAKAYDHCRNREVNLYQIPGHVDVVGVSDTVDRWIAPVAPDLFTVDIVKLFRDMNEGTEVKLPIIAPALTKERPRTRRSLITDDLPEAPRKRRAILN
jgi:hypothetical protein